jgi:TatD DNase family protein
MKDCLRKFLDISKKYDVPVIIHSRKAELETIDFLEQNNMKGRKVIMHCFSGRKHLVKRIIDNGWLFSIPCNIIRSEQFQNIVKDSPMSQLLTETDAPYLSPIPGKRNDSRNIAYTIKKIAELKGLSEEDTANIIFQNYQRVFL